MARRGTVYIEDGNTVRQTEFTYPETWEEHDRRRKARDRKKKAVRARAVQLRSLRLQTFAFIFSTAVICMFFFGYLYLQNSINTRKENISDLKQQISTLKDSNAAAESRIATASNIENIKTTAETNLGMVYANKDQIVYYEIDDEDYMNQYENVP